MINLLPLDYKRSVQREYRQHVLVVSGLLFSMVVLVALGIAAVIYFSTAHDTEEILSAIKSQQTATSTAAAQALDSELALFNRELSLIEGHQKKMSFPQMVADIVKEKNPGINIESFNFGGSNNEPVLRLEGRAGSRGQLLAFIETLKKDQRLASVDSPVSNLIKDRGAEFTITIKYHGQ